jgi:peroxin-19
MMLCLLDLNLANTLQMQAAGSPPADLVGDMAAAQEAFGAPEEGCPQQ